MDKFSICFDARLILGIVESRLLGAKTDQDIPQVVAGDILEQGEPESWDHGDDVLDHLGLDGLVRLPVRLRGKEIELDRQALFCRL